MSCYRAGREQEARDPVSQRTANGVAVSPSCEGGRLPESFPQGRRAGKAQCVETSCSAPHTKRTPQVDTNRHTVTRSHSLSHSLVSGTHAQCMHQHVSHERLHLCVCEPAQNLWLQRVCVLVLPEAVGLPLTLRRWQGGRARVCLQNPALPSPGP